MARLEEGVQRNPVYGVKTSTATLSLTETDLVLGSILTHSEHNSLNIFFFFFFMLKIYLSQFK